MAKLSIKIVDAVKKVYRETGNHEVTLGGRNYTVSGTKRLVVKDVSPKAAKGKKAPAVDQKLTCTKCGKEFVQSRFNPYYTECKECRKGALAGSGESKRCKTCGKTFTPSRFNPYLDRCPDCRKAARDRKTAHMGKAKKSA